MNDRRGSTTIPSLKSALTAIAGCAALSFAAVSQAAPLTIKSLAYNGTLPFVQSGNAKLDYRINNLVYLDMVGKPAPARLEDGLPEKKEEGPAGTSDIRFEVVRNDGRILALVLSAEGCGAYCEGYSVAFNFDAVTGRRLVAADLFTPAGAAALAKRNAAQRTARLKAEIARLRKEEIAARRKAAGHADAGKKKVKDEAEDTYFRDAIGMYEGCVEFATSKDTVKYQALGWDRMKIGADKVTFVHGRCSNHAMRALDDVGEQENAYSFKELAPHLSEFGRYILLGGSGKAPSLSGPYNQLLRGRVGQAAITLSLGGLNEDNSLSGLYYYDKYRTPIHLSGQVTGNKIELEEFESAETPKPAIRATINGETLEGFWVGKKQVEFKAAP